MIKVIIGGERQWRLYMTEAKQYHTQHAKRDKKGENENF